MARNMILLFLGCVVACSNADVPVSPGQCDCSQVAATIQAKMEQLEKKLSHQEDTIHQLNRSKEAERAATEAKLQRQQDAIAKLTQSVAKNGLNNTNVSHLHLHVSAKDFIMESQIASRLQSVCDARRATSIRQRINTLLTQMKTQSRRVRRLEERLASHISEVASQPSQAPTVKATTSKPPTLPDSSASPEARHVLDVTSSASSRYGPLVALPGGEALVADRGPDPDKLLKVDSKGHVAPSAFTSRTMKEITGLLLQRQVLYILQSGGLISRTQLSNLSHIEAEWQVPDVISPYPGALVHNKLYLVDYNNNNVLSVNLQNGSKTTLKSVETPSSLATAIGNGNQRLFVVSQYSDHQIAIFNSTWNLTTTIGGARGRADGQLYLPWQSLVTPWSTILVADTYNDRVSEFSLSGRFLRHVLTSCDGLYHPLYISYSRPFLWVTHRTRGHSGARTLKRYPVVQ